MSGILQHSGVPKGHIHGAVNWEFSTYDTLLDYTVLTAQDLHKIAYVVDAGSGESGYFILDAINTLTGEPTWVSIFGGAGVGSTNLAIGTVTTTTVQVTSDTGTDATLPAATNATAGVATASQISKLEGIASGATANATNAELRDRSTHTGTQAAATISDFTEVSQDTIAAMLVAGANVTLIYNDVTGTLTISSSGGGGGGVTPDAVRATRTTNIATAVGWNKVVLQAETYDTGNICDLGTARITPRSAGYYLVNARVQITASATNVTAVYKNGARVGEVGTEGSSVGTGGSCLVYCNGTTDYIELYVYTAAIATINSNSELTYIEVIGPINATGGGGGGGSTNLAATLSPTNIIVTSDTGTDATLPAADGTNSGLMVPAQFTKLAGVAAGATANSSDATLLARANHTGTQTASTISDLTESVQDIVGAFSVAGTNMTVTYNDGSNTLTFATTATVNSADATLLARANHTGTQTASTISDIQETVEDIIGTKVIAGANVTITYNDTTGETSIAASGGGGVSDGDKGDVTVSSSGTVWTVDNDAITFAKMQNISTNRLLGRSTASTGDIEQITLGTNLSLSGGVLNAAGGTAAVDNHALLVKWRKALGRVRSGNGNAKMLCLGDSLITGSGGSGSTGYGADSRKFNFVSRVKDLLNSYHAASRADMVLGTGGISGYTTFDPRYVLTNWADNQSLDGAIGKVFYSNTNGGTLVFTPTTSWDRVEIFYPTAGSQGTFDVSVSGSSVGTVNAAGSTDIASSTFNATLGVHGVTITKTNSNGNYILGIRVWDSTKSEVEIIQAGWSGAKASEFVTNSLPWDALGEITKLAPDLTVVALSINDAVGGTNLTTYSSQLQTIITTALASGDCILTTGIPSAISVVSLATQQTYIDAIAALAVSNNIVFINQFERFISYEIANPAGFYTDTLHPNGIGYADMAQEFFREITNI